MHFYADAGERLAREVSLLGFDESDYPILCSMDSEVARHISAGTGDLGGASLADENFAVLYLLAAEALDAEALASIVMDIFGGTASFDM